MIKENPIYYNPHTKKQQHIKKEIYNKIWNTYQIYYQIEAI